MRVYKFGGASVKDAPSVKNLADLVKQSDDSLVVVVSAMGKTTKHLEKLVWSHFHQQPERFDIFLEIRSFHFDLLEELFPKDHVAFKEVETVFTELKSCLQNEPSETFNFEYDKIVSFGEIISTTIVNQHLNSVGVVSELLDARRIIKTDNNYREANIDADLSTNLLLEAISNKDVNVFVIQGFIGGTNNNNATTFGLEGSDYTAALIANFINAESVTFWKDVSGILNADPKWFDNTQKIDKLTYTDAIELAFYGANVLHPKTIQPVKQKMIPLYVKSFKIPAAQGTVIGDFQYEKLIPSFIFKIDQVLIDIHPEDLSFITEENLETIFSVFAKYNLRINLMQNTAVSFRVCVNNDGIRMPKVIIDLQKYYTVSTASDLELITIRYYDQETIDRVLVNKEVLLEQHSKDTVQMVVKKVNNNE